MQADLVTKELTAATKCLFTASADALLTALVEHGIGVRDSFILPKPVQTLIWRQNLSLHYDQRDAN